MIRVERPYDPPPYPRNILERGQSVIARYFDLNSERRQQRRSPLEKEWFGIVKPAREYLDRVFHRKCAYCETPGQTEIEHFRPKAGANNLDGSGSLDHYAWLMLDWRNHYTACAACNRSKRTFFPLKESAHLRSCPLRTLSVLSEGCFLIRVKTILKSTFNSRLMGS